MNTSNNHHRRILQLRKNCVIEFEEREYRTPALPTERKKTEKSKSFSEGSKKRMMKVLSLLDYYCPNNKKISFVTLTLSSPQKKSVNYYTLLNLMLKKIYYNYGFNYVWKAEHQENNNVHFHVILLGCVNWKFIRSSWNKIQSSHVDEYQMKMKEKYRRGYFFDSSMLAPSGKIVDEDVQKERYKKGVKSNWRNPNSVDVKIVGGEEGSNIGLYISKYINKSEEKEIPLPLRLSRYWGCSDVVRNLKYTKYYEDELSNQVYQSLTSGLIKVVRDEVGNVLCKIYEKKLSEEMCRAESAVISEVCSLLFAPSPPRKNVEKVVKKYSNLFEV